MIKIQNITPISEIKQGIKDGYMKVEQINKSSWLVVFNTTCYCTGNYMLKYDENANIWELTFTAKYDDNYVVKFSTDGDMFEILSAVLNGKNEKSETRLKKYKLVCLKAHCLIKSGMCKTKLLSA